MTVNRAGPVTAECQVDDDMVLLEVVRDVALVVGEVSAWGSLVDDYDQGQGYGH